jgi:hypothetical protein
MQYINYIHRRSAPLSAPTIRNFRAWFLEVDIRIEFRLLEDRTEKKNSIPFTLSRKFYVTCMEQNIGLHMGLKLNWK